jgi:hypothetical protein
MRRAADRQEFRERLNRREYDNLVKRHSAISVAQPFPVVLGNLSHRLLTVFREQSRILCDFGKRRRPDLLIVVEAEREIRPSGTL